MLPSGPRRSHACETLVQSTSNSLDQKHSVNQPKQGENDDIAEEFVCLIELMQGYLEYQAHQPRCPVTFVLQTREVRWGQA